MHFLIIIECEQVNGDKYYVRTGNCGGLAPIREYQTLSCPKIVYLRIFINV